jgi:ubiquinone/menaquinone biosynthesis C-methylase UbiE
MIDLWVILKAIFLLFLGILVFIQTILRLIKHYRYVPTPAIATQVIDNPIRRRFIQKPETVAERMYLKPGMIVVEIGPGKGSYTIEVAKRVLPDGKVYAVDIHEAVVTSLKKKLKREGVTNVFPVVDDAYNMFFEDGSVDRVFAIACLPEIPYPVRVLREAHRILRESGLVSLSELFLDPDYPRRITEMRWAEEAGFELDEMFGNWFIYQLNFRKKKQ